jgi:hypothetical protein
MTSPGWRIRLGQPADRDLLATFCCADPNIRWQTEVEHFIRTQLADWTFDPHAQEDDPRLLLALSAETDQLFGVAAHEQVTMRASDGATYPATKLEVIAIAQSWQAGHHTPPAEGTPLRAPVYHRCPSRGLGVSPVPFVGRRGGAPTGGGAGRGRRRGLGGVV